eukprot:6521025-Karenia_brevis.AAC.1
MGPARILNRPDSAHEARCRPSVSIEAPQPSHTASVRGRGRRRRSSTIIRKSAACTSKSLVVGAPTKTTEANRPECERRCALSASDNVGHKDLVRKKCSLAEAP